MQRCAVEPEAGLGTEAECDTTYKFGTWYDAAEPKPKRKLLNFEVEFEDSGGRFSLDDWRKKQSWYRYLFKPAPLCRSLYQQLPLLIMVTLITIFAGLYHDLLQTKHGWLVLVSSNYFLPYYYLGIPISLMLVFKTNNCFDRWWEARRNLGDQQNHLRNAARLTCAWVYRQDPKRAVDIVRLMSLLAPAAGAWILHDIGFLREHEHLLSKEEFRYVVECNNPAVALGTMISYQLCRSGLQQFEKIEIESELGGFMNTLGSLNRLSTMPIYLSYSRNCLRMIMWFLFGLPFALWASMSWMTLVAVLVSTVLLATIENIGTQIEQPLLVLPVRNIVNNTKRHVEATIDSMHLLNECKGLYMNDKHR